MQNAPSFSMDGRSPASRDPSSLLEEQEASHRSGSGTDLINYFVDQDPIQSDLDKGVAHLQKIGTCGTSVYEHVRQIIKKILETHPDNVIDFFEEFSRQIRLDNYYQRPESFMQPWVSARSLQYAKLQLENFNKFDRKNSEAADPEEAFKEEEEEPSAEKDYEELLNHLLPHIGLGFPKKSTLAFIFAMKKLEKTPGLVNVRFLGKIFGLKKNYFVAEATMTGEERERRLAEKDENENNEGSVAEALDLDIPHSVKSLTFPGEEEEEGDTRFVYKMPPKPVAKVKKPVEVPAEEPGTGLNKKTYFVCYELGEDWTELPDVTPAQIVAARQFPCYLTGDLEAQIVSYPAFPGKEVNYLRAQIARISAACHISPQGLYILNEDDVDDDDDEDAVRTEYILDEEFEGQPLINLLEPNMEYWTHHHNEILPQGRIRWWNPKQGQAEEENEEEEEEEEEKEVTEEEPEEGKQLLTSVAEDVFEDDLEAWTVKPSCLLEEGKAFAVASSNIWPGGYAFARETRSENIYFGWGQKFYRRSNFTPVQLPPYQPQYHYDLMEQLDPSPEQEEEYRLSLEKKIEEEVGEEGAEEEGEEEED